MIHLLHPMFVHFTAAFLVAGAVAEAVGLLARRETMEKFGAVLVLLGTVSLLPTVVTGFLAQNSLSVPREVEPLIELHERVGLGMLALFLGTQFWKGWVAGKVPDVQRTIYAAILLIGVVLVVWGAFLGGELVYLRGVGVLR